MSGHVCDWCDQTAVILVNSLIDESKVCTSCKEYQEYVQGEQITGRQLEGEVNHV